MSIKACDQCGKCFTSTHRTTCYVCKPTTGPSKAQMLAMAGLEDDGGSCSVGGMAVDLGLYPTVEQADDMAAVIAEMQAKLEAANARVAELRQLIEQIYDGIHRGVGPMSKASDSEIADIINDQMCSTIGDDWRTQ